MATFTFTFSSFSESKIPQPYHIYYAHSSFQLQFTTTLALFMVWVTRFSFYLSLFYSMGAVTLIWAFKTSWRFYSDLSHFSMSMPLKCWYKIVKHTRYVSIVGCRLLKKYSNKGSHKCLMKLATADSAQLAKIIRHIWGNLLLLFEYHFTPFDTSWHQSHYYGIAVISDLTKFIQSLRKAKIQWYLTSDSIKMHRS